MRSVFCRNCLVSLGQDGDLPELRDNLLGLVLFFGIPSPSIWLDSIFWRAPRLRGSPLIDCWQRMAAFTGHTAGYGLGSNGSFGPVATDIPWRACKLRFRRRGQCGLKPGFHRHHDFQAELGHLRALGGRHSGCLTVQEKGRPEAAFQKFNSTRISSGFQP